MERTGSTRMVIKLQRRRTGFTLIEIMVVIFIIGILLTIAIPQFMRARERSSATACQRNLREIQGAKERWAMDNDRGSTDTPLMTDLVVPGVYLRGNPACSSGGTYAIGRMDQLPTCSIGGVPS